MNDKILFNLLLTIINKNIIFILVVSSSIIFIIGLVCILITRKNIILILIGIEIMLISLNFFFLLCSIYLDDFLGYFFNFFILTVAAAEAAIGLAILILFYRLKQSIELDFTNNIKG